MPDLLIRDCDVQTKRALAVRAAQNGRSQQAEALSILREALSPSACSWAELIRRNADSVDGMEFELPRRHVPRVTAVEV